MEQINLDRSAAPVLLGVAAAFGLSLTADARAQDAEAPASRIHFSGGVDYTTSYFFRGIRQEDEGFIVQPWGELSLDLASWDDASLGLAVGIWNSIHGDTDTAGAGDESIDHWYEADFYFGPSVAFGNLSLALLYTMYASPSDAFTTVEELAFSASWDDAEDGLMFGIPIAPSATIAFEIDGDAADGQDGGVYLELGIEPSVTFEEGALADATLSFPATLGISLDNYYQEASGDDETFGYATVGAALSYPLPVGAEWGEWSLSAGVDVLLLGDTTKAFNDDDDVEVIGTFGIAVSF